MSKKVLVTCANGGMGSAFVAELLKRGAEKIYVAARDTASLDELLKDGDRRLVPLPLDVTDPNQIAAAASAARDVTPSQSKSREENHGLSR